MICLCFLKPSAMGRMWRGQVLSGVMLVLLQSFPFLRLVGKPRLENPVYSIYLKLNTWFHAFLKDKCKVKWKQLCPGFEPRSQIPFLIIKTIIQSTPSNWSFSHVRKTCLLQQTEETSSLKLSRNIFLAFVYHDLHMLNYETTNAVP